MPDDSLIPVTSFDSRRQAHGLAERLRDYVATRKWPRKRQARWEAAFELLIATHGFAAVNERLKAYIDMNLDRPRCCSGDDFRNNWEWIGDQIDRRHMVEPPEQLTTEATRVIAALDDLNWPEQARQELSAVVERSLTNLKEFVRDLKKAPCDKSLVGLRNWIMPEFADLETVIEYWFRAVHKRLHKWSEWSGSLAAWVWIPTHEQVQVRMRRIAGEWTGYDDGGWDRLLALTQQGKS